MMSSIESIIDCAKQRGLKFVVDDLGQPVIRGNPAFVTDALKRVVAEFRQQIIEFLNLQSTKPAPATEPDFKRTVKVMDGFGQTGIVVNQLQWKTGQVAWQYLGETGWRPIVGREDKFPSGITHA